MAARVMVTGAAGRIGRAVLALLAERGIEVNALVLDDPGDLAARLVVTGDAADAKTVRAALEGADAVIHLAAIPTPARNTAFEVFAGNSLSTFTVLEEAYRAGIRHAAVASSWGSLACPGRTSRIRIRRTRRSTRRWPPRWPIPTASPNRSTS